MPSSMILRRESSGFLARIGAPAGVLELVDSIGSEPVARKSVWVRFPPPAFTVLRGSPIEPDIRPHQVNALATIDPDVPEPATVPGETNEDPPPPPPPPPARRPARTDRRCPS